ncbi:MAG: hypothetical protein KAQ94_07055 [Arcobacteraceae bacterium]|nr:hypothetical protein [Arcobacteraceae bacterium]
MTDIILITLIIIVIAVIIVVVFTKNKHQIKSSSVKKSEIILKYQNQLKNILRQCKDDKDTKIKLKKLFLQKCSSELSRNIFFTQDEAKQIIQKLAQL